MKTKENTFEKEVGFVRPDALKEELTSVKVIGRNTETEETSRIIKVIDLNVDQTEQVCPSYITQYYG